MDIIYIGDLGQGGTCLHRMQAFQRLGFQVHPFDVGPCLRAGGLLTRWLRFRVMDGPAIRRLNRDILRFCLDKPTIRIWFDKPIWMHPGALDRLRLAGKRLYNFNNDNPFHTMREPGWHIYRKTIRQFDVSIVPRESSIAEYQSAGADMVTLYPFSFDPFTNYPATPWPPFQPVDVSHIGSPFEERPAFLAALAAQGIPLRIGGDRWSRHPGVRKAGATMVPPQYGDAYRRAIWEAKINLAFVTRSHRDVIAHKAVEIAASGSFLLAVRCEGHLATFDESKEAAFFQSVEEAADKIRFYLAAPAVRERVALAGCRRAWRSGYANEERIAGVFRHSDPELAPELARRAGALMAARRRDVGID